MSRIMKPDRANLTTEKRNLRSQNIDQLSTSQIVQLINTEDAIVAKAVAKERKRIAAAVDLIVEGMRRKGRLFYVGATRAKDKLYLTWAKNRRKFSEKPAQIRSRFLKELDSQYIEYVQSKNVRSHDIRRPQIFDNPNPMPDYENESQEYIEFQVGMRVRHQSFGKGVILKIDNRSGGVKLIVMFDSVGEKRLVLPYAKLEIL